MNEIEEMDDESEEIACLENITLAEWAALYDSCQKSFTKKSKSVDVDNPLRLQPGQSV